MKRESLATRDLNVDELRALDEALYGDEALRERMYKYPFRGKRLFSEKTLRAMARRRRAVERLARIKARRAKAKRVREQKEAEERRAAWLGTRMTNAERKAEAAYRASITRRVKRSFAKPLSALDVVRRNPKGAGGWPDVGTSQLYHGFWLRLERSKLRRPDGALYAWVLYVRHARVDEALRNVELLAGILGRLGCPPGAHFTSAGHDVRTFYWWSRTRDIPPTALRVEHAPPTLRVFAADEGRSSKSLST